MEKSMNNHEKKITYKIHIKKHGLASFFPPNSGDFDLGTTFNRGQTSWMM